MPLTHSAVKFLTRRSPKFISPKAHAFADYAIAGSFFMAGALMFRRNKRAAISAFVCGGAEIVTSLCTDYPGGITDAISFPTHGRIDMGMAAMAATLPDLMEFGDEKETWVFRAQAIAMTAVAGLTDFGFGRGYEEHPADEAA